MILTVTLIYIFQNYSYLTNFTWLFIYIYTKYILSINKYLGDVWSSLTASGLWGAKEGIKYFKY